MKFYSQIGQDEYYIKNISCGRKYGVFIDVGANNGIDDSNTASLEINYGWSGICIEANPYLITELKENRPNSIIVNAAAWHSPSELLFEIPKNNFKGISGNLLSRVSGISRNEKYFKDHFSAETEKIKIQALTLTDIIKNNLSIPYVIDYLSLDTEGSEIEALQGIDFSIIDIKFLTIEHGDRKGYKKEIIHFMESKGYNLHRINRWDVEFIK